jgi:hypothetical protein
VFKDSRESVPDNYGMYDDFQSNEAAIAKATAGGGLTRGQMSTALRNMGKELKPVEDVTQAIEALDQLLAPHTDSEDVPGLGYLEGQNNLMGKGLRALKNEDLNAEQIHQARQRLLRNFIRESAGLAQTLSETQGVLESYGIENLADEDTFIRAYPEIKVALASDLERIQSSYLPEVFDQFQSGYETRGTVSPFSYEAKSLEEVKTAQDAAGGGFTDKKRSRLAELRRKREEGTLGAN